MKYILALDVGGTKIAGALIKNSKIIKKIKIQTHAKKGKSAVINKIFYIISLLLEATNKKNVLGIGIGLPGPLELLFLYAAYFVSVEDRSTGIFRKRGSGCFLSQIPAP